MAQVSSSSSDDPINVIAGLTAVEAGDDSIGYVNVIERQARATDLALT
jgi:hypothetical protein